MSSHVLLAGDRECCCRRSPRGTQRWPRKKGEGLPGGGWKELGGLVKCRGSESLLQPAVRGGEEEGLGPGWDKWGSAWEGP